MKVILFVTIAFVIGSLAYYFKYKSQLVEQQQYDYSQQDSMFWASGSKSQDGSDDKKTVDYKQELLDFSNDNYSERAKDTDQYSDLKISINRATIEELILLPGIGEKTAENIISFRRQNGKFSKVDDLIEVPGIGSKKLEKIKSFIIIE